MAVKTTVSLISAGTERTLIGFGKANWFEKARQQPEKVRQVLEKAQSDGAAAALEAVLSKLDQPLTLGYCNVGRVAALGSQVTGFNVGDRVASNGNHAEIVVVPKHLCAKIPDNVSDESAVFTVVAAIGLQGIRLAAAKLGECVAVVGLGLIGLLTVQMLRAQGCKVLGVDINEERLALARAFGADTVNAASRDDVLSAAAVFSRAVGMDAVIITASTKSNEPVVQAAQMCRKRGRIVLVGVTGLELNRADFYEKELSFQVSCSYGPGRYDPSYEQEGRDYPIGYVRWTEQRNFEAVLDLMAAGAINVEPLISHQFAFDRAGDAFELLTSDEPSLGILLNYSGAESKELLSVRTVPLRPSPGPTKASVVFIGAGNYASRVLIPAFKRGGASLRTLVSAGGVNAVHFGEKYGFATASTDLEQSLGDPLIDTAVIATRHNEHARQVLAALRAGKHVFCEKPLCLTLDELSEIQAEAETRPPQLLMVGFNRRFAPLVQKMKRLMTATAAPAALIATVNAGAIPANHWTQDPTVGGGRIVGEACHFVDLLRFLAGASICEHSQVPAQGAAPGSSPPDIATISLKFENGSTGTIHYLSNGHRTFPKERIEVFGNGRVLRLDNFKQLRGWGWADFTTQSSWRQDKGQSACARAFVQAVQSGGPSPVPLSELIEVSRVTIEAANALN